MHESQTHDPLANWDDFRIFLEISKIGSFSGAAKRIRSTQPTVSRRIESLEQRLGVRLFDRFPSGVVLTLEGEKVLESVRHVEEALVETQRRILRSDGRLEGQVRISVSDGLSTFWLSPRLGSFQETYPAIAVELRCSMEPANPLETEDDLCIRFKEPKALDLIVAKLGTLHAVPWASPAYLERFGTPTTAAELCNHRLLNHPAYQYLTPDCDAWLALIAAGKQRSCWTNSSTSLLSAVQNSLGIALLPTYFCTFAENVLPLDLEFRTRTDIWLTYHPNVRDSARVRAVIEWIKSLFDGSSWPWFRDEFRFPKTLTPASPSRAPRPEISFSPAIAPPEHHFEPKGEP